MNDETKKTLEQVKNRLVDLYNPKSIHLFGSHAWGTPRKDSDIDLFIVVENSDLSMTERARLGYSELWDIAIPLELIVYTEQELKAKKEHPSSLSYKILNKGIVLYEAAWRMAV